MSENFFISQFEANETFFSGGNIENNPPISAEKIKQTLKKIFANKKDWQNMGFSDAELFQKIKKPEVIIGSGNTVVFIEGHERYDIAYRTYRGKKKPDNPFYSISANQIKRLKNKGIKYEVLLFWEKQESGNSAPTYLYVFELDCIESIWTEQKSSRGTAKGNMEKNPLYRLSFHLEDGKYVYKVPDHDKAGQMAAEKISLYKFDAGTTMSGTAGNEEVE